MVKNKKQKPLDLSGLAIGRKQAHEVTKKVNHKAWGDLIANTKCRKPVAKNASVWENRRKPKTAEK